MPRLSLPCVNIVLLLWCSSGHGELFLTAEVSPIAGLAGFNSYRITATSDFGNIVGFDFSRVGSYGVLGPMNQVNPFGQSTIFNNQVFGDYDRSQDTQFLFNGNDLVTLFPEESSNYLHAVFAVMGDKQLTIGNRVPFLQIATSAAQDVSLKGSLVVRRPNDTLVEWGFDIKLSDIQIGAAPLVEVRPVPAPIPEPIFVGPIDPIVALPPVGETPTNSPGGSPSEPVTTVNDPPAMEPPSSEPAGPDEPPFTRTDDLLLGDPPWSSRYIDDWSTIDPISDLRIGFPEFLPWNYEILPFADFDMEDGTTVFAPAMTGIDYDGQFLTFTHSNVLSMQSAVASARIDAADDATSEPQNAPEPANYMLLLIAGFGAIGLVRSRR